MAPETALAGKGERITIPKADLNKLTVLHDGKGHVVVIRPSIRPKPAYFFYGDGKTMYAQVSSSGGADRKRGRFNRNFWAPRLKRQWGRIEKKGPDWHVLCGKRRTKLSLAGPALIAKALSAKYFKRYWKRKPYALARDEMGVYYYIDRFTDAHGGKGYRLFVGPRGNLKKTKLTNIVNDSEGDIFATRKGTLRMVLSKRDATWIKKGSRTKLVYVPPRKNQYMIYTELGVYVGKMGVPCDDM